MRKMLRVLLKLILCVAVLGAALAVWKREELGRLGAVLSLFDEDRIVANFSNMNQAFLAQNVSRGDGPPSALPTGDAMQLPDETRAWINRRAVTSLLVVKGGEVVFEEYTLGTNAGDLRISWSMAKSFLSALVGVLHHDGTLPDLDVEVTEVAPTLAGTAYDGATLRDVLHMASGVAFDEDYLAFFSDINKMGREVALGGSLDDFAAGLSGRAGAPGEAWRYVSIDTHVIGMVVRGATGRDIGPLLSEKIITPLGLEATPYYLTDGDGTAFVLGGLNMTTRDYARFGLMFARGGNWNGTQIVPEDWVRQSTRPTAPTAQGAIGYGFQWWIPANSAPGVFMARGVYGQYIWVDTARDLVIVSTAADRDFRADGVSQENIDMFRALAQATD